MLIYLSHQLFDRSDHALALSVGRCVFRTGRVNGKTIFSSKLSHFATVKGHVVCDQNFWQSVSGKHFPEMADHRTDWLSL